MSAIKGAGEPRPRRKTQNLADAVQERLDATPERLARAREAGAAPTRDADPRAEMRESAASSTRST